MQKTVGIYVRVSTLEQAETGYSLKGQEDSLIKYSESLGYKVFKVYKDGGFSGSNTNRPGLTVMLEDVKSNLLDVVLVYKLDRLSRSQKDTLDIIENVLLPNDCDLISISESFDTSTPFGRAMVGILSVFAQLERENILERMALGKRERAKKGGWNGGSLPWAYDYIDGQLIPNENADDIRLAYKMYLQGCGVPTISKKIVHKSRSQIRAWLMAPIYAGMIKYNDILEKGQHEGIVSWEDYSKVQDIRESRKQHHSPPPVKNLLAGICYCKYCGGLITRKINSKHEYLACYSVIKTIRSMIKDKNCPGKYHRMDKVIPYVENEVLSLAYDDELFKELQKDKEVTVIDYTDKVKERENKINKLLDLYLDEKLDKDLYINKKESLTEELNNYKKLQSQEKEKQRSKVNYKETLKDLREYWETMDNIQKNSLLKILIDDIIISNEEIVINWAF